MLQDILTSSLSVLAVAVLILVNALWVAAEFAIVRVRRTRLEELAGEGVEAAKDAVLVVDAMSDYLALTQIGITVASLGVGWLAEDACARLLTLISGGSQPSSLVHGIAISGAFLIVTVLHVLLGEQVPKILAVRNAEPYLLVLVRPLRFVHVVLRPLLRILERMSTWILHRLGHGVTTHRPLTEEELKLMLAESHRGGVVTDGEAEIIVRAFEFADKQAEEIMIPAADVAYLSLQRTLQQNLDVASQRMHARLPVCHGGLDSIIGVVSMKDAWPLLDREHSNAAFEKVCRPPIVIPLDWSQDDILRAFRKEHGQMGIVRDGAGKRTLGIITLEDVLEALVGDVREAKDASIAPLKPRSVS
jgi:CBS domain containing-hemolysin-like protein